MQSIIRMAIGAIIIALVFAVVGKTMGWFGDRVEEATAGGNAALKAQKDAKDKVSKD